MLEIKLLDNKIDYKNLKPMEWDLVINGTNYDIYHIDGYFHTIRYQKGSNAGLDYYCCPVGTTPNVDTLTPYDGPAGGVRWGIQVEEDLRYRNKWGDQSWHKSWTCCITRNGEIFYEIYGRGLEYLLAKAQITLVKLQEHPIPFHFRNWRDEIIGRTVFYNDEPGIITLYHKGSVIIEPDGINFFKKPAWSEREDFEREAESVDGVRVDILDDNIFWHRTTWAERREAKEKQERREAKEKRNDLDNMLGAIDKSIHKSYQYDDEMKISAEADANVEIIEKAKEVANKIIRKKQTSELEGKLSNK